MPGRAHRPAVTAFTFWRVWTALFLFFLTASVFFFDPCSGRIAVDGSDADDADRIRTISGRLEDEWVHSVRRIWLQELPSINPENAAVRLSRFMESNSFLICVTVWPKNQAWPLRNVNKDFWTSPGLTNLSDPKRAELFNSLFPNRLGDPSSSGIRVQNVPELSRMILVQSLTPPHPHFRGSELHYPLDIPSALQKWIETGEKAAIMDERGQILGAVPENWNPGIPETDSRLNGTEFENLPWRLVFYRDGTAVSGISGSIFYAGLAVGFILTWILAFITSWLIDKPARHLSMEATQIARGDFQGLIMPLKNYYLNRLVRLFNYMAEEMGRMQKLDVHEIITEKNKTETILRNIADGVLVTDAQNRIAVVNNVLMKWFNLTQAQVMSRPISDCIRSQPLISLIQEIRDGRPEAKLDFAHAGPSGEKRMFQAHSARLHDQDDKLLGAVTVFRDITREKEIDQMKTELISMVAHELKSPLTSIFGFSELLLESNLQDPKANEYARIILNESTRLTDLVNKFLDLSRLESGRTEIHMNPFNLRDLIHKIIENYQVQAENKGIKVLAEIPSDLPAALGEQDMIEQVILNLYSNAIKYSPRYSKIGIEVKEHGDQIVVSVIDNGYGIPEESLPHIFEKFYRVTREDGMEEEEGSGLGLALAREIIDQHGGTIKVNSKLGVGSVFSFTLPKGNIA